jgi:hypothetical protein
MVSVSESDASTPTSISTNRNSIITAPVYTTTWTTPRNGASCAMYRIAMLTMTNTRHIAACTARLTNSRPSAARTMSGAITQNRTVSPPEISRPVGVTRSPPCHGTHR